MVKKISDVSNVADKSAESFVSQGYAEYVKKPKDVKVLGLGIVEQEEPKQDLTEEQEAEFGKWKGTIERTPSYYGTTADLKNNGVPIYLWERLAEVCEPVKKALEERDEKVSAYVKGEPEKEIRRSEYGDGQKDFLTWNNKKKRYFVNIDKTADYLIDLFDCKTIYGKKGEICYTYDGRMFRDDGRAKIKTTTECLLDNYARTKEVNEIFEKIKRKTETDKERFEKTDINLIPLNNCVWNVKEKKPEEHSPKNNFRFIIEIKKDNTAKCINFLRFLNESCYPEDIPIIQEWFGFNLYRRYFIKKILILLGEKNTGKSVLLNVLTTFIGEANKTGISIQQLCSGSDFTRLSLKDKLANIFDDVPATDVKNSGNFKMAVGDGYIVGEEKFGDYTQFRNFAKHTTAGNKCPPVKDNDDLAYFDRNMVVCFDNTPEKIDPFLIDKLTTPEELSGILNWALEGLYRLLENGEFSYKKTAEETKVIMETSGNPLLQFAEEVLVENPEGKVTKEQMFEVYSLWANEFDKQKLAKNQLSVQLHKVVKYMIDKRDKIRFWGNVCLKPEWATKIIPVENPDKNQKSLDLSKKKDKVEKSPVILEGSASKIKEQIDELDDFPTTLCSGKKEGNKNNYNIIKNKASNSSKEKEDFSNNLDWEAQHE